MERKREKKRIKVTSEIRRLSYDLKSTKKQSGKPGAVVRLALFLGAGASFQSNIPVASNMIRHFKDEICKHHGKTFKTDEETEQWIKARNWYKDGESEYCQLFEKCYENEPKRRSYIESIIERKQPSVGYIVLANLIKYGYLKTIITTNFDSLVSLACYSYTDIFPVVYSLGNFASEMTVSSERPRILKIHGDFLYSKLKNTTEDLEKPDENMEVQVERILKEYDGMIIIGYSGGDNSVMSIFEKITEGKTIYWCGLSEDSMSERARKFLQVVKGTFVKIEGFDELMQIVRVLVNLDGESIAKTFRDRQVEINIKLDEFKNLEFFDEENGELIKNEETEKFGEILDRSREITRLLIVGNQAYENGNHDVAERSYREAIKLNPNYPNTYNNLGSLLGKNAGRQKEAEECYRKTIELNPNDAKAYNNLGNLLIKNDKRLDEAKENYEKAIELQYDNPHAYNNLGILFQKQNKIPEAVEAFQISAKLDETFVNPRVALAGVYKRINKQEEAIKYADESLALIKSHNYRNLALLHSIINNKEETLNYLKLAVEKDSTFKVWAKSDPDFEWLRDDPRFKEIVGDEQSK